MKYILYIIFSLVIISGCYGFYLQSQKDITAPKFIGAAVAGFFFVWMPLFIYHRYKGKDIRKYMITDETIKTIKDEADSFIEKKG
ncbi:hypothetical protein [Pseudofulvibacter geojedonensis]|uniref:Lipoprotein n=1 Tax=Pseudofulvibacter geojedonensis TaxID=1123758 RepID=A0ABW3I3Q6_9FLAO